MRFSIEQGQPCLGALVYREKEFSFDTEQHPGNGHGSLLVNDLQLEIDDKGRVLYVWGLCPYPTWSSTDRIPPAAFGAVLRVHENSLVPGTSKRVNAEVVWPVSMNKDVGWICVGDSRFESEETVLATFAPGAVAVLQGEVLRAIWLRPRVLPKLGDLGDNAGTDL